MTRQLFAEKFGGDFKKFLESPIGQSFLLTLNNMSPAYEFPKEEHLLIENRGAKRGYQICLTNIVTLCVPIKTNQDPEPNYGVPNKP